MKLPMLFIVIVFLFIQIEIGAENKKLEQKTFKEIFGEKWEEKEQNKQNENDQKKQEIIQKFNRIKAKIKQKGRKYSTNEWIKIELKITKKLGTNRKYIYQWIKALGLYKGHNKSKTDEQKIEFVQKFNAMKNEYKQNGRKYSKKEWQQNKVKICKKIGISQSVIDQWKKGFGISERKPEKEKLEKMKIYWQMKGENPKMSDEKISKILKINRLNIIRWKKQFGEELNED